MKANWRTLVPLIIIVGIGAALRLDRVGILPMGFYRDEAFYALDAAGVLQGRWALYFAANNGREPLFIYWLAIFVGLFGHTVQAVRSAAAVIGIVTIPAIYFAGRWLFSSRVGVLSAAILALNFWHLAISRVAYRAITLPLMLCLAIGCAAWAAQSTGRTRTWRMAVAGVLFGLTVYTYTSAQMLLPFGLAWLVVSGRWLVVSGQNMKAPLFSRGGARGGLAAFILGLAVAIAPLGLWLTHHADLFFNRAGQVSILNPIINHGDFWGTLVGNIGKAAAMFVLTGDRIWRHNLALRPVFDGLLAPFFLLGVIVIAWRAWRNMRDSMASRTLLLWLAIFLIPTILAEDTPHYLRAIGVLPAACIFVAIGLEAALAWASRQGYLMGLTFFTRPFRGWVTPPALIAAVVFGLSGVGTYTDYFDKYVIHPLTGYWLEAHNVALADLINSTDAQTDIYLDQRLANDNPALQFLTSRTSVRLIQPNQPINQSANQLFIFDPNHDWAGVRNALSHPAQFGVMLGPQAQGDNDPQPRRAFVGIRSSPILTAPLVLAQFAGGIELLKAAQTPHGMLLMWRAQQAIPEDYAVFVHVLQDGKLIAQHDGSPAEGLLPMPQWRVGDVILDLHPLSDILQPAPLQFSIGVYRRSDGRRLNVVDKNEQALADSVMILAVK